MWWVWVNDFLDWLWCVVADVVVVWEGSVAMVVPHHPSFQTFPHHHYSSIHSTNHVPWWRCGCCVVEVAVW